MVAEDAEIFALRSATEGPFRGHDGVRAFLADNRESFDVYQFNLAEVRDLGDGRVLGVGTIRIRGKGSGVETEVPTAGIGTFRNGRATHWRDYGDRQAALEAAGLA